MYYPVNMGVVNYFGTQIPEIEKTYGHMHIESAELSGKNLTEPETISQFQMYYCLKTQ